MINARLLIAVGVGPTQAKQMAEPLAVAAARYGIDTPSQVAGWLGQILVESAMLATLEEGLFYRTAARIAQVWPSRFPTPASAARFVGEPQRLASFIYAGVNGNGGEASGDGWTFRGGGPMQHTGRGNYRAEALATGLPFEAEPALMRRPDLGSVAAASFWRRNGCAGPAEAQDWDRITRIVNGPAMLKRVERARHSRAVLRAMATQ